MVSRSTEKLQMLVEELINKGFIEFQYDIQFIIDGGILEKVDGKFIRKYADGSVVSNSAELTDLRSKFNKHYNSQGNMSKEYAEKLEEYFKVDAKYFTTDFIEPTNNALEEYKPLIIRHNELEKRFNELEAKLALDKSELTLAFKKECELVINEILEISNEYEKIVSIAKDDIKATTRSQQFALYLNEYLTFFIVQLKRLYNKEVIRITNLIIGLTNNYSDIRAFSSLKEIFTIKNELENEKKICNIIIDFNEHVSRIVDNMEDPFIDKWCENDDIINELNNECIISKEDYDDYNSLFSDSEINTFVMFYIVQQQRTINQILYLLNNTKDNFMLDDPYFQEQIIKETASYYYDNAGKFEIPSDPKTLEKMFIYNINTVFNDDILIRDLKQDIKRSEKLYNKSEELLKKYNVK